MASAGSVFCEHKRLRTSCPTCKASAVPAAALQATPFVTRDEREKKEEKRAERTASPSPGAPSEGERKPAKIGGPGKPLMPTRPKKKGISADEAASATAWWVKKG